MPILTLTLPIGHVFPPDSTQYTRLIKLQGRQPNFLSHNDALKNSHTDDPVRKVKLDALEFDSWLKSTAILNWLDKMAKYCEWYNISDA